MRYQVNKRDFLESLILTAVILFVTFFTCDTVLFGTNKNKLYSNSIQAVLGFFFVFMFLYAFSKRKRFGKKQLALCVVLIFCVISTMLVHHEFRNGYIFKCSLLLFSFFAVELIDIKNFANCFNRVLFLIATISIICYSLQMITASAFYFAPQFYNLADYPFRNLFLYVQSEWHLFRNFGIYREPGVYQMFLILALLFELYYFEKPRVKRILVFSAAVFTTFSTTGIIAYGIWIFLALVKTRRLSKQDKVLAVLMVVLSIFLLMIILGADAFVLWDKLFKKVATKNVSYLARLASITVNIKLWLLNPVFGLGIGEGQKLFEEIATNTYGMIIKDNTNTLLIQFALHGTVYGFLWITAWIKGALCLGKTAGERVLIAGIILVLCLGENLTYSPFGNILMMYGLLSEKPVRSRDCEASYGKTNSLYQLGQLRKYRDDCPRHQVGS